MDKRDTTQIVHLVQDLCPTQKWRPNTPEAWEVMFAPFPCTIDEARAAVLKLRETQNFIDPGDIIREVRRARHTSRPPDMVPDADPDDVGAYLRALRAGRFTRKEPGTTEVRTMPEEVRAALPVVEKPEPVPVEEEKPEAARVSAARLVLATMLDSQRFYTQARAELEEKGVKLTNEVVVVRAAELAEDFKDRS
jgi:hypothetical protein